MWVIVPTSVITHPGCAPPGRLPSRFVTTSLPTVPDAVGAVGSGAGDPRLAAVHLHTDPALGALHRWLRTSPGRDEVDVERSGWSPRKPRCWLTPKPTQNMRRGLGEQNLIGQAQGMLDGPQRVGLNKVYWVRRYSQSTTLRIRVPSGELASTG